MKRICMIVQSLYPNDVRIRREAEALEERGVGVDVICQRGADQDEFEQYGLVRAYRISAERPKESIGRYLAVSVSFAARAFFKLQSLARENHYALVQAHNMPDYLIFSAAAQKLRGVPVVLDLHDLMVELFQAKWGRRKNRLFGPIVRAMEKLSCRFADRLITTSDGFKASLVDRGVKAEKITLVLNTADPKIFKFQPGREFRAIADGPRLLYHGTVTERFGLTLAIEAVAKLTETMPGATLHIYGKYDESYRRILKAKVRELRLEGNVFLEGWRTLEQIAEIIAQSDIGLVPYQSDPFMDLALSTKTFEYAATGLPVVASRIASITSIFDDRCIQFFDSNSAQDAADKIIELCRRPELRKSQAERSFGKLTEISGTVMKERYVGLIEGLIGPDGEAAAAPSSINAESTIAGGSLGGNR